MAEIQPYIIENWGAGRGLITSIEDKSIPDGAASVMNNWSVKPDKIELRRGSKVIGTKVSGLGRITGLGIAEKADGVEVLYRTRKRKIEYYNSTTEAWVELGTDTLPAAASGEDISMARYQSLAGWQFWLSSPNSDLYKIMVANPASIAEMSSTTFKGYIKIIKGRMLLWNLKDTNTNYRDKSGFYGSEIDKDEISDYTRTVDEVLDTGDGAEKTFSGTLSVVSATKSCFGIKVTDDTETFYDDDLGVLTGDKGGTGTINYTSGAISVTFKVAPTNLQDIKVTYYTDDPLTDGIAKFTHSTPRTAAQGFVLRQDDGGDLLNVSTYQDEHYCLHKKKSYVVDLTIDDTNATNKVFRSKVGIPFHGAKADSGDGIYLLDDSDKADPRLRLLTLDVSSDKVVPISISKRGVDEMGVDFSSYLFDKSDMIEWGDVILLSCRTSDSSHNNTVFSYNKISRTFEKHDLWVSFFAIYNGALIAGDSVADNVYELFSGFDDDGAIITNEFITGRTDLNVKGLKHPRRMVLEGEIKKDQVLKVSISTDNSPFVEVGEIRGDGSYVSAGQSVAIGAETLGKREIGGGSSGSEVTALPYEREFKINVDKGEFFKIKLEATEIGYVSVSRLEMKDIRYKGERSPNKFTN